MAARIVRFPLAVAFTAVVFALSATVALAQTPQPFPRPGTQKPASPAPAQPQAPPPPDRSVLPPTTAPTDPPTEATLGVAIYPGAEFLASYDAGRGQRYYLFG
ncbi:MAG TPA: hypothetical protein VH458_20125, partial [Vicinamibacterales bacterium]